MTSPKIISLLLVSVCTAFGVFAQPLSPYSFSKNEVLEKQLLGAIKTRYDSDVQQLEGAHKKTIAEIYKYRYENILNYFTEDAIIMDKKASAYLQEIAGQVIRANPSLNLRDVRVLFCRAWWPNAFSMGEGTVFFNIGLFNRLDNESEAAFTICHELAHYYLNHSNKKIRKHVELLTSDELQKQLKAIQKSEYRRNEQLTNLAIDLSFSSKRHSREFEEEADSMALVLMKNTGYNLNGAISCMGKLDSIDQHKFNKPLKLETVFNFAGFPFKTRWIEAETLMFVSEETEKDKALEDSLKTHPDCSKRIEKLTPAVTALNKTGNRDFIVNETLFHELKSLFDYEGLVFAFEKEVISACLYNALKMLQYYPDDVYLHTLIGKCLNEIYAAQKAHTLGRIVALPSPYYREEFNKLLHLIQNVRLYEIASISYYFLHQNKGRFEGNKSFAAVWETSVENFNKQ